MAGVGARAGSLAVSTASRPPIVAYVVVTTAVHLT